MPRRSILPLAAALLALSPAAASGASAGATFLTGGLDLPAGAIPGGESGLAGDAATRIALSDDGRYVAFTSHADGLDPAAHPDVANVFRKDRLTGEVVLVSRASGAAGAAPAASSDLPAISDDGSRVAFRTTAPLDPADTDAAADVYVRDVLAGTTTLASRGEGGVQATSAVSGFDLSGDGRHVAFATASALAGPLDGNGVSDVYRWDLDRQRLALVSASARSPPNAGNGASTQPAISDDGRWVAYVSTATDLVPAYAPSASPQVFVRDVEGAAGHLVSGTAASATAGSNGTASEPDVTESAGRVRVAYTSTATDVDGDDTSSAASVYHRSLENARSSLASRADGALGASADERAHAPSISDDGARVVFSSDAANLGSTTGADATYVRWVAADRLLRVSPDGGAAAPGALAGDGAYVSWTQDGGPVTPDHDPDLHAVFGRTYDARGAALGTPQLLSRPPGTAPFLATSIQIEEVGRGIRSISADGRYVVFAAASSRLPGGLAGVTQVYRRDTLTGAIELVSRANGPAGAPASGSSGEASISADGTRVAFLSSARLDGAHPLGTTQAYVRDLAAGTTGLASRADGAGAAAADDDVSEPRLAAGGRHLAFTTAARNLGDPAGGQHVYLRDLAGARTTLVDRAAGVGGAIGDDSAETASPSADGRLVAFASQAANLHGDDPDHVSDVYVRDVVAGVTTLASRRQGLAGAKAAGPAWEPSLSADGNVVAFTTGDEATAPEAGPWNGRRQVVARLLTAGGNALVSRGAGGGAPADADAGSPSVSGDGGVVAFSSAATNLLPGVGGGTRAGVFARTLARGALSGPPAFGLIANEPRNGASAPSISDDGHCLAFGAVGHNALSGSAGDRYTGYVHVVSEVCPAPLAPPAPRRALRRPATPRPRLSRASLSRKRFRVGARRTAKVARAGAAAARRPGARGRRGRRAPAGTTVRFSLNTAATVAIVFERPAQGRLVGRFCRKPGPRLRRNLRCVRFVRVGRIERRGLAAGRREIRFSGRIGRKALRPGKHRARLRASNAAGSSRWVRLSFRVVRR